MNLERLPLFPLQAVLFPRSAIPLHIFEERYRSLIGKCLEEGGEFGIILAQDDRLASIGCSAGVTGVIKRYDDGRLDIVVEGRRRFRMLGIVPSDALYQMGSVSYLEPPRESIDGILAVDTIALYNEVVRIVYGDRVEPIGPRRDHAGVSFLMAQKAGMELADRQRLLEVHEENDRLHILNKYFRALLPRLHTMEETERVVRSDGYLTKPSEDA